MKQTLLILMAVALVGGCGYSTQRSGKNPLTEEESVKVIEAAIRQAAGKPTGELTKADLEKVTKLDLRSNKLTEVKGLEKLTQLTTLWLNNNKLTEVKGLEKLTQLRELWLQSNRLTDVKGLENLTALRLLNLLGNPDLTKAQIAQLQKTLPNCKIYCTVTVVVGHLSPAGKDMIRQIPGKYTVQEGSSTLLYHFERGGRITVYEDGQKSRIQFKRWHIKDGELLVLHPGGVSGHFRFGPHGSLIHIAKSALGNRKSFRGPTLRRIETSRP